MPCITGALLRGCKEIDLSILIYSGVLLINKYTSDFPKKWGEKEEKNKGVTEQYYTNARLQICDQKKCLPPKHMTIDQ